MEDKCLTQFMGYSLNNMFLEIVKLNLRNENSIFNTNKSETDRILQEKALENLEIIENKIDGQEEEFLVQIDGKPVVKRLNNYRNKRMMEQIRQMISKNTSQDIFQDTVVNGVRMYPEKSLNNKV